MELLLLAVAGIAAMVALVMSIAAWRLSRDARARSAARVAALAAAAAEPEPAKSAATPAAVSADATLVMPARAAQPAEPAPEPLAVSERSVRVVPAPAPWPAARVSAFTAQPRTAAVPAAAAPTTRELPLRETARELPLRDHGVDQLSDSFLGAAAAPPSNGRQRALAVAALVLFAVVAGGGYWTVFGKGGAAAAAPAAAAVESAPLELVSLRHERRGGRLAVTGLVRNPVAGAAVEQLSAVVFLFDQQGGFVTSARASIDFTRLSPGDESPFVISVDAPGNVARYRVSFRTDAGIVPHVDRRGQPAATTPVG